MGVEPVLVDAGLRSLQACPEFPGEHRVAQPLRLPHFGAGPRERHGQWARLPARTSASVVLQHTVVLNEDDGGEVLEAQMTAG
jgi:hypothetical protein